MARITFDRTGFPFAEVGPGLAAGLLPVARVQVEHYLGGSPGLEPAAADGWFPTGPRPSWRTLPADRFETLFAAGVGPDDAARFAAWVGPRFRLPTEAEWRAADAAFAGRPEPGRLLAVAKDGRCHPAAAALIRWLLANRPAADWSRVGLFADGLLEWVAAPGGGHGLHGRPRPAVKNLIHNPRTHPAVRPRPGARDPAFGFRLVRTG